MNAYLLQKGGRVYQAKLNYLESEGMAEVEIATYFGISRQRLYEIRKKMGWPQKQRSDKGKLGIRVSLEDQRNRKLAYGRKYQKDLREYAKAGKQLFTITEEGVTVRKRGKK